MANIVCPQCHRIVDEGTRSCPGCKFNIKKYVKDMKKNGGSFNSTISLGSVYSHNDDTALPELDFLKNPLVKELEPAPQPVQMEAPVVDPAPAAPVVEETPFQEAPQEYTIMQGNVQPTQTYGTAPVQAPVFTSTQEYTITPGNAQPTQSHAIPQAATTVSGQSVQTVSPAASSPAGSRFAYKPRTAAAAPAYDPDYKAKHQVEQAEIEAAQEQQIVAETLVLSADPAQEAFAQPVTQSTEQSSLYAAPSQPAAPTTQSSLYAAPSQPATPTMQSSLYAAPQTDVGAPASIYGTAPAQPAAPSAQPSLYAAPQTDPGAPASIYGTAPSQPAAPTMQSSLYAAPQTDVGAPASIYGTAPAQPVAPSAQPSLYAAPQTDPGAPASIYGTAPAQPATPSAQPSLYAAPQMDPGAPASLYGTAPAQPAASQTDPGAPASLYGTAPSENDSGIKANLYTLDPGQQHTEVGVHAGIGGSSSRTVIEKLGGMEEKKESNLILVDPSQNNGPVFESPLLNQTVVKNGGGALTGTSRVSIMEKIRQEEMAREEALNSVFESPNLRKAEKNIQSGAGTAGGALSNMGDMSFDFGNPEEDNIFKTQKYKIGAGGDEQRQQQAMDRALQEALKEAQRMEQGRILPQPGVVSPQPSMPAGSSMYGQPAAPGGSPMYGQPAAPSGNSGYGQPAAPSGNPMYGQPAAPSGNPLYGQPAAPSGNPLYGQPAAPSGNPLYAQPAQGAGSSVVNFNPAYGTPGQTPAGGANPFLGGGQ
ncbi:MAG: hypothetical protein K6G19_01785 [Lachnospiraceae bacterium]|nr:hypothetical protein [Lachnospiraceae bacterium]